MDEVGRRQSDAFNETNIIYATGHWIDVGSHNRHIEIAQSTGTCHAARMGLRDNVGLYALPGGTGAGPAVWCHGLLPDYHASVAATVATHFLSMIKRPRVNGSNLSATLIESLSAAYGQPVVSEDVFDAILCLLSARSYTRRFAEDLEDVFPHVPFPARHAAFEDAVRIGREIRAVETFAREPREAYRRPGFARVVTRPSGAVAAVELYRRAALGCALTGPAGSPGSRRRCGALRSAVIACSHAGSSRKSACRLI